MSICSDPGLPRFYVKVGNRASIRNGFVGLEEALREATASATKDIPLRSNAVHPLSHKNPATNIGFFVPDIYYSFEPNADWIEITASHKGGFYGSDYRWLLEGKRSQTGAVEAGEALPVYPRLLVLGLEATRTCHLDSPVRQLRFAG